MDLED